MTLAGCVTGEHLGGPEQATFGDDDDDGYVTDDTEVPYDPCQFAVDNPADVRAYITFADEPQLLDEGGTIEVSIDGQTLLIANVGECFVAMAISCTHSGCDIEYQDSRFSCPCHGSKWTYEGKLIAGPASDQAVYPVVADADGISIL